MQMTEASAYRPPPTFYYDMFLIAREDLKAALAEDKLHLIMMTSPQGFAAMHIPGSVHFGSWQAALSELCPEDDIVVHGASYPCMLSTLAYRKLKTYGFEHVRRSAGGLEDWTNAGHALEGRWVK